MSEPRKPTRSPKGLGSSGKRFWRAVTSNFDIEDHHRELLSEACRCLDRLDQVREVLESDGPTVVTRSGDLRSHPLLTIERDTRRVFGYLVRTLGLNDAAIDGG